MGWTTEESWFYSRREAKVLLFSAACRANILSSSTRLSATVQPVLFPRRNLLTPWSRVLTDSYTSSSSSALQLFVSFGLLNYFFLSCVVCFQLFTPIFLKSFLTSSSHLTLGLPFGFFAYGFHLYFTGHSLYMPQTAQSFVFYISYYIFVINCFFQFLICFESPLSV